MRSRLAASSLLAFLVFGAACGPNDGPGLEETRTEGQQKTGVLMFLEARPTVTYQEVDGALIFQGDIGLPKSMVRPVDSEDSDWATVEQPLLTTTYTAKWPNGVIPYTFSSSLSSTVRSNVQTAIDHWKTKTGIQFVPRGSQADYVTFQYSSAGYAWADIGRHGGQQTVNLLETTRWGVIAHEMGHTVGLYHEHTRPDRDSYVTIYWGNIKPGLEGNFSILSDGQKVGTYDDGSIMHYPSYELSTGGPTILRKDGSVVAANYAGLSARDVSSIQQMYPLSGGGIIIDSNQANNDPAKASVEVSSNWTSSTNVTGYYGSGYWVATTGVAGDPANFKFYLPSAATKTVDVWWSAASDRSTSAPIVPFNAAGTELARVYVNQQINGGRWNQIGTYSFSAGWNTVAISRNTAAGYYVVADAVRIR